MRLNQAPAGKYTVIVVQAKVFRLKEKQSVAIVLEMVVTNGPHAYKCCTKILNFKLDKLDKAKSRFNRLGSTLTSWDTLEQDAQSLLGAQLVATVSYDENNYHHVIIYDYIGRGDPKKYS